MLCCKCRALVALCPHSIKTASKGWMAIVGPASAKYEPRLSPFILAKRQFTAQELLGTLSAVPATSTKLTLPSRRDPACSPTPYQEFVTGSGWRQRDSAAKRPQRITVRAMSTPSSQVPTVSVAEAHEMLSAGAKYLDVRTEQEFANGHAAGAVNVPVLVSGEGGMVPNGSFLKDVSAALPDKDAQIVVGCKMGRRSEMAWHVLDQQDYSNVANIAGGFDDWLAQGLPAEK